MKRCVKCHGNSIDSDWRCSACGYRPEPSADLLLFARETASSSEDFNPHGFATLTALEDRSFWFRSRNRLIVSALQRFFPGMRSFLEVGCGSGYVLAAVARTFPSSNLAGSEMFVEGLDFARSRVPSSFLFQADARNLPFENEFDVVGAFDMLEHVAEDTVVLRQMFEATRPGGGIALTVPQHPFLWSEADRFARHKRRYTRAELAQKVEAAGFVIAGWTSFVTLLLPLLAAARQCRRLRRGPFDPWAEFALSRPLDRLLEAIMRIELLAIRKGVVFPVGGSLLMVARKPKGVPA